jgi:hypothetical protein
MTSARVGQAVPPDFHHELLGSKPASGGPKTPNDK